MEFICEQLSDAGIYSSSKISKTDDTYVSYINNNISLCEYLKYAISQGAIDISCISTKSDYYDTDEIYNVLTEYILKEFDNIVGIERLCAVHINDSMNPCGSHKDRHEKIGKGYIGLEAFERIINDRRLRKLPFYLETPNEIDGYAEEISRLRKAAR